MSAKDRWTLRLTSMRVLRRNSRSHLFRTSFKRNRLRLYLFCFHWTTFLDSVAYCKAGWYFKLRFANSSSHRNRASGRNLWETVIKRFQLTLLHFDLYRAVKPIELVDAAWTKHDKYVKSPQLLKLTDHATLLTYWVSRSIVESDSLEERTAMFARVIEVEFFCLKYKMLISGNDGVRTAPQLYGICRIPSSLA